MRDLNDFFGRIAPEDDRLYRHTAEGPDDMPAHIRAALTLTQLSVPVVNGNSVARNMAGRVPVRDIDPTRIAAALSSICWGNERNPRVKITNIHPVGS